MQNTTTVARRGIQLNKQEFRKAIEKAQAVNPRVIHIGAHYGVQQSDLKSFAQVTFTIYDNRLFATCTCYAHTRGHYDQGKPTPCYHIAAAALSGNTKAAETNHFLTTEERDNAPLVKLESKDIYTKDGWDL